MTLGSLRDRQDYLIAEGLLVPYKTGDETAARAARVGDRAHPPAGRARSRPHARPRPQLLRQRRRPHLGDGLPAPAGHAEAGRHARLLEGLRRRASASGTRWRSRYGYSDFAPGTNEAAALQRDPRHGLEGGPALHDQPGHEREPARRSVVERHRSGRGAHAHARRPARVDGAVRRAGDQARPADGAHRGGAGAALPPPPLSGRGGGVGARRHPLHLRDAGRRPRAGEGGARRASSGPRSTR